MTNWREVFGYRRDTQPVPEGYEEGDPPYSEDEDFDPEGRVHNYTVQYSEVVFGHGWLTGRCKREAQERYMRDLETLENTEEDDSDIFEIHWRFMDDQGREE